MKLTRSLRIFATSTEQFLGLGVSTDGESLGKSPNNADDLDDWGHQ
ncbi:MAG: hypothetical protein U5K38_04165 [Woeseiaceae bacterium]|nr:hypothetical protein [Woeseiaceae bacterium]